MDMGFESKHIVAALRNTSSLELAMDYILNCTETSQISESLLCEESSIENVQSSSNRMETDACEMSENSPAAATSNQNTISTQTQTDETQSMGDLTKSSSPQQQQQQQPQPPSASTSTSTASAEALTCPKVNEVFLITDEIFYSFCEEIVHKIFELMSNIPDIITSGAELIYVLYTQNRLQDKEAFTKNFASELKLYCDEIRCVLEQAAINKEVSENLESVISGQKAVKLLTRVKVYTMLFDEKYNELRKDFCKALANNNCLFSIVSLLSETKLLLTTTTTTNAENLVPVWLHAIIEFIDKFDIVANAIQQKINTFNLIGCDWRWYDMSCGKWNCYSEVNNVIIRNAYQNGDRTVNIYIGRQRYTINFNTMTQISESYGSHRPISPSLELTDLIIFTFKTKSLVCNTAVPSKSSIYDSISTYVIRSAGDKSSSDEYVVSKSVFQMNDRQQMAAANAHTHTHTHTNSAAASTSSSVPMVGGGSINSGASPSSISEGK